MFSVFGIRFFSFYLLTFGILRRSIWILVIQNWITISSLLSFEGAQISELSTIFFPSFSVNTRCKFLVYNFKPSNCVCNHTIHRILQNYFSTSSLFSYYFITFPASHFSSALTFSFQTILTFFMWCRRLFLSRVYVFPHCRKMKGLTSSSIHPGGKVYFTPYRSPVFDRISGRQKRDSHIYQKEPSLLISRFFSHISFVILGISVSDQQN